MIVFDALKLNEFLLNFDLKSFENVGQINLNFLLVPCGLPCQLHNDLQTIHGILICNFWLKTHVS